MYGILIIHTKNKIKNTPTVGIEPTATSLKGWRSTAELNGLRLNILTYLYSANPSPLHGLKESGPDTILTRLRGFAVSSKMWGAADDSGWSAGGATSAWGGSEENTPPPQGTERARSRSPRRNDKPPDGDPIIPSLDRGFMRFG
jgi:hypothetical protein